MKPENNQVDYEKSKGHVELWTKNKEDRLNFNRNKVFGEKHYVQEFRLIKSIKIYFLFKIVHLLYRAFK
jgi:hypothetical protein